LLLNPGFDPVDLFGEHEIPDFSRAVERTLRQDLADEAFPNVYFNPKFCWSGAFRWWEAKLRDVAHAYQRHAGVDYWRSLQVISQHLATLELLPYHSVSSPPPFGRLASVAAARTFVNDTLVPKAKAGELTIIVTRRAVDWGLSAGISDDIVVYPPQHARSASLTMNSVGGQALFRRLVS